MGTLTVLIEMFRGFPQYQQVNAAIVPELGNSHSLTNRVHYIN